jgi:hypothetical protein
MKDVSKNSMIEQYSNFIKCFKTNDDCLTDYSSAAKRLIGLDGMYEIARTYGVTGLNGHLVVIAFEKILDSGAGSNQKWWEIAYMVAVVKSGERSSPQGIPVITTSFVCVDSIRPHSQLWKEMSYGSCAINEREWVLSKATSRVYDDLNGLVLPGNGYAMLQSGRA